MRPALPQTLAVAVLLGLAAIRASADVPPSRLSSIEIELTTTTITTTYTAELRNVGGRTVRWTRHSPGREIAFETTTLRGYADRSYWDPDIDFLDPNDISKLRPKGGDHLTFWLASDLTEVQEPAPFILFSSVHGSIQIPIQQIKSFRKIPGALDERKISAGSLVYASSESVRLIRSGSPIHSCRVYLGEMHDEILVSYNEEVGQKEMAEICNKSSDPDRPPIPLTEAEAVAFLRNKKSFILRVPVD